MSSGDDKNISGHQRSKRCLLLLAAIALAATILASCGDDDTAAESGSATSETSEETTISEEPESEAATESGAEDAPAAEAADETGAEVADETGGELFPDVLEAVARQDDDGTWTFDVTLSSPYDTPERYADAWRVVGPDGEEYGIRVLTHDHAAEQPFTRSHSGIAIPDDVDEVTVEGRDQVSGWGGATLVLALER